MSLTLLSDDYLFLILDFLNTDIKSLVSLSSCNSFFLKYCRQHKILIKYYRSLFPHSKQITEKSIHNIDLTYFNCNLGEYEGWDKVHNILDPKKYNCTNIKHYSDTEIVPKNVKWKNLFKMCAIRTHTLNKSKYSWTNHDKNKLEYFEAKIKHLKIKIDKLNSKKANNLDFKNRNKHWIDKYKRYSEISSPEISSSPEFSSPDSIIE